MQQLSNIDFLNVAKIVGLPLATANGEPVVFQQLLDAIQGLAWKDDVRVRAQSDVNLAAPGAVIDGVTMVAGDRFFPGAQTNPAEIGLYIWNGAAVPATRALDMNASTEFNNAVFHINEGTNTGAGYRISVLNPVVGTTPITFAPFGQGATQATETLAGVAEIATQGEVDAGTDDLRFVTAAKLAAWAGGAKRFAASFGDGTATSFAINHNFNNADLVAQVRRVSDNSVVGMDQVNTSVNTITLSVNTGLVPTANQYRVSIVR